MSVLIVINSKLIYCEVVSFYGVFKVRKSFAILGVGINCNPTMARRNLVLVLIINCIAYTVDCIAYSVDCIAHSDSSL